MVNWMSSGWTQPTYSIMRNMLAVLILPMKQKIAGQNLHQKETMRINEVDKSYVPGKELK